MRLDGYRKADEDTDEHLERRPGRIKVVKEKELTSAEIVRRFEQLEKAVGSLSPHQKVDYSVPPTNRQYYGPRWANGGQTGPFVGRRMWTGQAGRFNRLCYECQSPEHFARECPVRLQQGPAPTENPEPPCERMFLLYTYLKAFRLSGIYVCTWSERAWTCRRLPLGPTFKFRALCTGAVSISCSARFVEVTVQSMLRADL